jgi:hypothetical protein
VFYLTCHVQLLYFIILTHVLLFLMSFNQTTVMHCHSIKHVSTCKMVEILFNASDFAVNQGASNHLDFLMIKYAFTPWSASTTRFYEPI